METQLRTKDIPKIIGVDAQGLGKTMEAMAMEYCLWWCGNANKLDAELMFCNQEFQDWWLDQWMAQDERFLRYAIQARSKAGQLNTTYMNQVYLTFHSPMNMRMEKDGALTLFKTMLPNAITRSWMADIKQASRTVNDLIKSISNN